MPLRQYRHDPSSAGFRLPAEVRVSRQPLSGGVAYVFRHTQLGELGRLALTPTASGETFVVTEVAGELDDPMTQRRRAILEPLCLALSRALGPGRATPVPPKRPGVPVGQVACEEVRCDVCGTLVAFLIFAPGAVDEGRFEDYARMMYPHYAKHNVPTYIIGPEQGGGSMRDRPADILKVWPDRTPVERLRPDEFNPRVVAMATRHCP
jgi:hypothetical protein